MEDNNSRKEFFFNHTLKGITFYFYCPNMTEEDKKIIIGLIKENKGVRNIHCIIDRKFLID
jgi:hypothetical protein